MPCLTSRADRPVAEPPGGVDEAFGFHPSPDGTGTGASAGRHSNAASRQRCERRQASSSSLRRRPHAGESGVGRKAGPISVCEPPVLAVNPSKGTRMDKPACGTHGSLMTAIFPKTGLPAESHGAVPGLTASRASNGAERWQWGSFHDDLAASPNSSWTGTTP